MLASRRCRRDGHRASRQNRHLTLASWRSCRRAFSCARQRAAGQGRPGNEGDSLCLAQRDHFPLFFAVNVDGLHAQPPQAGLATLLKMCFRDKPRMFGPSPITRMYNLVARTISFHFGVFCRRCLARDLLADAQQGKHRRCRRKELIPASTAFRKKGIAPCSSNTYGRRLGIAVAHAAPGRARELADASASKICVFHGAMILSRKSQVTIMARKTEDCESRCRMCFPKVCIVYDIGL